MSVLSNRGLNTLSRLSLAAILCVSGALKVLPGPVADSLMKLVGVSSSVDSLFPYAVLLIIGVTEVGVAVWIVVCSHDPAPVLFSGVMLLCFLTFSLAMELLRPGFSTSCGCFGPVQLTIWHHFVVLAVMLMLAGLAFPRQLKGE